MTGAPPCDRARITAVLGPTNTGKTHLAMERLLGHASGMIGFPLRLLARENYDRAVQIKGAAQVALITGEEKILPPHARYFLCTVESMPLTRAVAFLAIDEIQMCADPDRGHIFTDRLLHARGQLETMFMGAETIRPLIRRLVPDAHFIARPRFSELAYTGPAKLTRLPRRSAVVAFSVADVYALAELVRRQRGGTAIVLGALSPRTRNAQVAMYQAGEVDYLVATDAIGMGLNMSVDHVAFAATRKFDGRRPRPLLAAELAQIAGRAGRYTKNGSFGTTAEVGPLDPELVQRIENHSFEPLQALSWRPSDLKFTSIAALKASLARPPGRPGLVRAREADDELALAHLLRDAEIVRLASAPERLRLLWDVCQIPDFGKVMSEGHARLLSQIFRYLCGGEGGASGREGRLPADWVAAQVDRLGRTDGDIEALMLRIAGIRTWTYISQRPHWIADAAGWQERTRSIEDRLSDALHERLIQRFVDRRTASLVVRMRDRAELEAAVNAAGEVRVEGHFVGRLDGLRFTLDPAVAGEAGGGREAVRAVEAAALRGLRAEAGRRVARLEADGDGAFALTPEAQITWQGAAVARLIKGPEALRPQLEPLASELLEPALRERVRGRLARWLAHYLEQQLEALHHARRAMLGGAARGLVYQVTEALGSLPRQRIEPQLAGLAPEDHQALRRLGLRIGRESVFIAAALKPPAVALRALLWCVHAEQPQQPPPPPGRVSVPVATASAPFYEAIGFRVLGGRAVRVDIVERLAAELRRRSAHGPFAATPDLAVLAGCRRDEIPGVVAPLGYVVEPGEGDEGAMVRRLPAARRRRQPRRAAPRRHEDAASPFAHLKTLMPAP